MAKSKKPIEKTPQQQLLEEYELPSSKFDPEFDSEPGDAPVNQPARPNQAPPRDPETGRFVPTTYQHSGLLTKQAIDAGLTHDQIAETPPEDLRLYISQARQDHFRSVQSVNSRAVVEPQEPELEIDWGLDEQGQKLGPQHYDQLTARMWQEFNEFKAEMSKRVAAAEAQARAAGNARLLSQWDKRFSKHPDIYGSGATEDLDPNSPEAKSRQSVLSLIQARHASKTATTPERDWDEIHSALYGRFVKPSPAPGGAPEPSEQPPVPVNRLNGKSHAAVAFEQGGALPRPTHREVPDLPKGEERAMRAVANKLRSKGQNVTDFDDMATVHEANLPD